MSGSDRAEYLRNAEDCLKQAGRAVGDEHAARWRRIAVAWLRLAEAAEQSPEAASVDGFAAAAPPTGENPGRHFEGLERRGSARVKARLPRASSPE